MVVFHLLSPHVVIANQRTNVIVNFVSQKPKHEVLGSD